MVVKELMEELSGYSEDAEVMVRVEGRKPSHGGGSYEIGTVIDDEDDSDGLVWIAVWR